MAFRLKNFFYSALALTGLLSVGATANQVSQNEHPPVFGVTGFVSGPVQETFSINVDGLPGFGYTTEFNGRYLFVGQPNFTSGNTFSEGLVAVYYLDEHENWIQTQTLLTLGGFDSFGLSLRSEGDYLFISGVGTPLGDVDALLSEQNYAGSVLVYKKSSDHFDGTSAHLWKLIQTLDSNSVLPIELTEGTSPDPNVDGATFGYSLDVDLKNKTLLISAPQQVTTTPDGPTLGAVFVFTLDHLGRWVFKQQILSPTPSDTLRFGYTVALDDGHALIATTDGGIVTNQFSPSRNGVVFAFRFFKSSKTWQHTQTLEGDPLPSTIPNSFGNRISIEKKTALITAPTESQDGISFNGAAYFYYRNEHKWVKSQVVKYPNLDAPGLGLFVGQIVGSYALISSNFQTNPNSSGSEQGALLLYKRNDFGAWKLILTLFNPPGQPGDLFGSGGTLSPIEIINSRLRMMIAGTTPQTGYLPGVSIFTSFP